jgi:hypothetical protein
MRRMLAGVVLALMLTGGAVQEPFQEAFVAWSKGDYASAFRLWRPLAAQGDAESQFYLATLYVLRRGQLEAIRAESSSGPTPSSGDEGGWLI